MTAIDLTGLWRFQPDPSGTGQLRGYTGVDYDDHRWREVWVPADFETCHPGLDTYEGAGWFRRWAATPREWMVSGSCSISRASMPMHGRG